MPPKQVGYINKWRQLMPDYEFVCWSEKNMNMKAAPFIVQAYESGTYAFVADYTRLYALFTIGGIYLDTDVVVNERFDRFLSYSAFTSYEFHPGYSEYDRMLTFVDSDGYRIKKGDKTKIPGVGLMSAIIGAEKNSSFIKDCLDMYNNMTYAEAREKNYTIPSTLAITAEKYGFKYSNVFQLLEDNVAIFPSNVFADYRTADRHSVAIHNVAGSWGKKKNMVGVVKSRLYRIGFIRTLYMQMRNLFEKHPLKYKE